MSGADVALAVVAVFFLVSLFVGMLTAKDSGPGKRLTK